MDKKPANKLQISKDIPPQKNKYEVKKISETEYTGPKKTFTHSLTKSQIIDLLDGYEETPFLFLKQGYLVRYFGINKDTKKLEFKMGGTIVYVDIVKKYVVITNHKNNWSVQSDCIFFQQMPISQIKEIIEEKYKDAILKQADQIELKDKLIKALNKKILELENTIELTKSTKPTKSKK